MFFEAKELGYGIGQVQNYLSMEGNLKIVVD